MRIDWNKETGGWQVFDDQGNKLDEAKQIYIGVPSQLITEGQKHHGWCVTAGKLERRGDLLLIT